MFTMHYKDYTGHVEFDEDAGLFHGEVANIRDVIKFKGTSVGELRAAFAESVQDYLNSCVARGETPQQPKDPDADLREELIRTYSAFAKVRAIAMGKYLEEELVYVLISVTRHDEALIKSLLKVEYDLHESFPSLCLSVHYIPVGDAAIESWMHYNETLIWNRDW